MAATIPDKDIKCRRIAELIASGKGVCESCREVGVSEKTFYRWRKSQLMDGDIDACQN